MASVNKVILVGNLGRDPESRTFDGGTTKTQFSLATTETWTKDGEKKEKTEWHNIVVWGKLAEICAKYLAKGRQVYIEGKLTSRSYDDAQGVKKYITEVNASDVVFLGSAGEGAARANAQVGGETPAPAVEDEIPF